ncbi:MAG: serine protease [Alcanivoracaceae bacterium]|nr:serine protease [Alcanivoracaceae bacterium]
MRVFVVMGLLLAGIAVADDRPATKVVGGTDATRGYSWIAGLHVYLPATDEYLVYPFCGGSLIAPGWVVTAAHCITSPGNGANPVDYDQAAEDTIVRIGLPDLDDAPQYLVTNLFAHPEYGVADGSDDSDIALVQLATKADVDTVSIANGAIMNQLETSTILDDVVRIIGWGVYDDAAFTPADAGAGNQPDFLQEVDLDYLPFINSKCRSAWDGLTMNMICAWEPAPPADTAPFGQDACFGDSGGPLMLPASTVLSAGTTAHDWLLGATSFGSTTCSSISQPGVYAKISNFDGWIEQTTAAAGDALIDLSADVSLPAAARPDPGFVVEAVATNSSRSNEAQSVVFELTMAQASLTPVDASGCTVIADGWRCTLTSLSAGQSHRRSFTADWNGAEEDLAEAFVQVYASEDDYRPANDRAAGSSTITLLPDPALSPFQIISNRNRIANVSITAANQSIVNSASDVVLIIDIPAELSVTDDSGCTVVSPVQLSCALGTLAADSSQQIGLQLEGEGNFDLTATLQNSNGDVAPGDTQQTLNITLKKSSSGGTLPPLWAVVAVLFYLRRKSRNQSSN